MWRGEEGRRTGGGGKSPPLRAQKVILYLNEKL